MELYAGLFQIFHHGQNHGLILIVFGKAQGLEVRQAADVVDITLEIQLHFQGAVPVFEGEHGAPVEPEIAGEDLVVKNIGDALVLQILVGSEEQLHDLLGALVGNGELAVGVGVLTAFLRGAAEGVVGVGLVEPVIFVQHADAFGFNGGNGVEQIPHDLEMVVHFPAAAHDVAHVFELPSIAGAAGALILFQNVNMLALHLAIAHQIAGGRQRGKAAADDVGGLVVYAFGLAGTGKRLIIAAGIIHNGKPPKTFSLPGPFVLR